MQAVDEVADVIADVSHVEILTPAEARIEDFPEIHQDIDDVSIPRQRRVIQVMNRAATAVSGHQAIGQAGKRFLEIGIDGHGGPDTFFRPSAIRRAIDSNGFYERRGGRVKFTETESQSGPTGTTPSGGASSPEGKGMGREILISTVIRPSRGKEK